MQNQDNQSVKNFYLERNSREQKTPKTQSKLPPLGVGSIIGECFSIIFNHILLAILLGIVPTLLGHLISAGLAGYQIQLGLSEYQSSGIDNDFTLVLAIVINVAAYAITCVLLIQLAYDAKHKQRAQPKRYLASAIKTLVPFSILNVFIGAVFTTGAFAVTFLGARVGLPTILVYPVMIAFFT
ncbi:hypothetical protein [Roseibium sp. SCP14]|uniref:hypothetical protein n=1 Tax=Roseibium sp. SCP14 TaxID=3141375 RepID=UPI00333DAB66